MPERLKVLFLCTGNSCRSQMAEGWAKRLKGDSVEAWSAGLDPRPLDPRAAKVMAEVGVDISHQTSKSVDAVRGVQFDYVVTLCGHANETCPFFPDATKVVHVPFEDPPQMAKGARTDDEALAHYRRVRDEIRRFTERLPESLDDAGRTS